MNFSIRKFAGALAVAALLGFGANARAATVYIAPGGSTTVSGTSAVFSGAALAYFYDIAFTATSDAHGSFSEAVFTDKNTGDLDFAYQFKLTSSSDANEFAVNSFGGWNTGVGYLTSNTGLSTYFDPVNSTFGTAAGTVTASRNSPFQGKTVNFTFKDLAGTNTPSYIFVVQTDATKFDDNGKIQTEDGVQGNSQLPVYEPAGVGPNFGMAPLPSTASTGLLMLGGFFGFLGIRRGILGKPVSA